MHLQCWIIIYVVCWPVYAQQPQLFQSSLYQRYVMHRLLKKHQMNQHYITGYGVLSKEKA